MSTNLDPDVVTGFGEEWSYFDQSNLGAEELAKQFNGYFHIFPWDRLPPNAVGFDLGCGTGRWAQLVAPRVGRLHCIDPSAMALAVAKRTLAGHENCSFHEASVDEIPLADDSSDFGYSVGVLHHVPDTQAAINSCVAKLKTGAPFLVYVYFAFDHKPAWYSALWKVADVLRRVICRAPFPIRLFAAHIIALFVYWPLARLAKVLERLGMDSDSFPLSSYSWRSLYSMRTDALDRFGTRLEKRFSREQIETMLRIAGLTDIRFSNSRPYWCAIGYKNANHDA